MARDYFMFLGKAFPEFGEVLSSKSPRQIIGRYRGPAGGHLLFRPIGVRVVTEVVASLLAIVDLKTAARLVSKLPVRLEDLPYEGIIWDGKTRKIKSKGRVLARRLILHMLDYDEVKPEKLRDDYSNFVGVDASEIVLPGRI